MSSDIEVMLGRALSEVRAFPDLAERVADAGDRRRHRRRLAGGLTGIVALVSLGAFLVLATTSTSDSSVARVSTATSAPKEPSPPAVTPVTATERILGGYSISPSSAEIRPLTPAAILAEDKASTFHVSPSDPGSIQILSGAFSFDGAGASSGSLPYNGVPGYLIIHSNTHIAGGPPTYTGLGKTFTVVDASTGKGLFTLAEGTPGSSGFTVPAAGVDMSPARGRMPTAAQVSASALTGTPAPSARPS
jgi:hypothetical protein